MQLKFAAKLQQKYNTINRQLNLCTHKKTKVLDKQTNAL